MQNIRISGFIFENGLHWRIEVPVLPVSYPGILFAGGGSTNSVEDRENGDLGAVAP